MYIGLDGRPRGYDEHVTFQSMVAVPGWHEYNRRMCHLIHRGGRHADDLQS